MSKDKLTPKQDLICDLLAARYRLGENIWTFDDKLKKSLQDLQAKGYITLMSGNVENTVRAYLTEKGKEYSLSSTYEAPIAKEKTLQVTVTLKGDKVLKTKVSEIS